MISPFKQQSHFTLFVRQPKSRRSGKGDLRFFGLIDWIHSMIFRLRHPAPGDLALFRQGVQLDLVRDHRNVGRDRPRPAVPSQTDHHEERRQRVPRAPPASEAKYAQGCHKIQRRKNTDIHQFFCVSFIFRVYYRPKKLNGQSRGSRFAW